MQKLLYNSILIFGNSRFTGERIKQFRPFHPVEVLNPGVNIKEFHLNIDTDEIRKRYKLDERKVLFTTARLVFKKNIETVIRSLPTVIKKVPNVLFLVVGDEIKRKELEDLSDKLGIHCYVWFLGHVENKLLPQLYCSANVFIMPPCEDKKFKDIETLGISFIEALPVIGGQSGGTTEAVVEGKTGLLVDSQNINEIAMAVIRLLTDQKLADKLGKNG